MSVVTVLEVFSGRTGSLDDKYISEYKRVFMVLCDSFAQGAIAVRDAVGIVPYDIYVFPGDGSFDRKALCKKVTATQREDYPLAWDVVAEYTGNTADPNKQNKDGNPTNEAAIITIDSQIFQEPCDMDCNGNAVLNTAGEAFDPAEVRDVSRTIITIEKNFATLDYYNDCAKWQDMLNSDTYLGFQPLTLKIMKAGATLQYENGVEYWKRKVEMQYRPLWIVQNQGENAIIFNADNTTQDTSLAKPVTLIDLFGMQWSGNISGWYGLTLNQGTYWIPGKGLGKILVDEFGLPIQKPRLLDKNGALLAPDATTLDTIPVYVVWAKYNDVPFAGLGMP